MFRASLCPKHVELTYCEETSILVSSVGSFFSYELTVNIVLKI